MAISLKNKVVLVTGASAGIGAACAAQLAASGAKVILAARRLSRIEHDAEQLANEHGVETLPLALDVSDRQAVARAVAGLPDAWRAVDILINNAGIGGTTDLLQDADPTIWDKIIDTNVKGLLYVTRAVLPGMIRRNSGHIVNIGSTAGHDYYMGGNVYSASKHAVKALTRSLRIDLKGYRLRVSEVDPGMTKTEFSEVRWNKEKAEQFYAGMTPLRGDDIADAVIYCLTRPEHVNIAEIMVYPDMQVAPTILHRAGDRQNSGVFHR